jgi:hypothetical protein
MIHSFTIDESPVQNSFEFRFEAVLIRRCTPEVS